MDDLIYLFWQNRSHHIFLVCILLLNIILKEKQKELVKLAHAKKDYTALADEIDILRDKKQELLAQRAETEGVKKRIAELTDFLQEADRN